MLLQLLLRPKVCIARPDRCQPALENQLERWFDVAWVNGIARCGDATGLPLQWSSPIFAGRRFNASFSPARVPSTWTFFGPYLRTDNGPISSTGPVRAFALRGGIGGAMRRPEAG